MMAYNGCMKGKRWLKAVCACVLTVNMSACRTKQKETVNKQVYDDGNVSAVLKSTALSYGQVEMVFIFQNKTDETVTIAAQNTFINGMPLTFSGSDAEIRAGKKYRQEWHADADLCDVEKLDDLKNISLSLRCDNKQTDTISIDLS